MPNTQPKEETQKTGYKPVDAVIAVFVLMYNTSRKDVRAFIITILLLMAVSGWGYFVYEVWNRERNITAVREQCAKDFKTEREYFEDEKNDLFRETQELKKEYLEINNDFKAYQKECNAKTENLLERIIKLNK